MTISDIDPVNGRLKGHVQLDCRDSFKVEEVRLDANEFENWEYKKRDSKGKLVTYHQTDTYFQKQFQLSGAFEATAGFKRDYPFEIVIPKFESRHGRPVSRTLKAVANIKGRPDVTSKEIHPFIVKK